MHTQEIKNLEELKEICFSLVKDFQIPQLVLLEGPLAVGKSQMVYFMCAALGVQKEELSSPTFSLINVYKGKTSSIYHVDLFRLKDERELESTAFWDIFYSPALVFVEWPELVREKYPSLWNKLYIQFNFSKDSKIRILKWTSRKIQRKSKEYT